MRELGYIEGHNIIFEKRFAAGRDELINNFVADLVQRQVDIIVVTGQRESIAAARATSAIPIVTIVNPDPIAMGIAQSLSSPGGNVTGLTTIDFGMYGKRIELLKQAIPSLFSTYCRATLETRLMPANDPKRTSANANLD